MSGKPNVYATAWHGLMEVAAVNLSAREQQTLSRIADELTASDPKLASTLGIFNRLTSGEEMPARQHGGANGQQESGYPHRSHGRAWPRRRQHRTAKAWSLVTAWVLVSVAAISVAVVLSHIGH